MIFSLKFHREVGAESHICDISLSYCQAEDDLPQNGFMSLHIKIQKKRGWTDKMKSHFEARRVWNRHLTPVSAPRNSEVSRP